MTKLDDAALAEAIRQSVQHLNELIEEASRRGLLVEIGEDVYTDDDGLEFSKQHAYVYKKL